MAKAIKENNRIDGIYATNTEGKDVAIFGRGYASPFKIMHAIVSFGEDPREELAIKAVFNIKGARDGANTLIVNRVNGQEIRKVRLAEKPEELRALFKDAGLENQFPNIQETVWNKLYQHIMADPYYVPIEEQDAPSPKGND